MRHLPPKVKNGNSSLLVRMQISWLEPAEWKGETLNVLLPTPAIHNLSFLGTIVILHSAQRWHSGRFVSFETPTDCGWVLTCLSRQQSTLLSANTPFLALLKPFLLYAGVSCILQIMVPKYCNKSYCLIWSCFGRWALLLSIVFLNQ